MNKQNLVRGLNFAGWVSLITLFLIGISGTAIPGWLFLLPPVFFIPALIIGIIELNGLIKEEKRWLENLVDDPEDYEEKDDGKAEADFTLTLGNCLFAATELSKERAEEFAKDYGKALFGVARGTINSGLDEEDIKEYIRKEMER